MKIYSVTAMYCYICGDVVGLFIMLLLLFE